MENIRKQNKIGWFKAEIRSIIRWVFSFLREWGLSPFWAYHTICSFEQYVSKGDKNT